MTYEDWRLSVAPSIELLRLKLSPPNAPMGSISSDISTLESMLKSAYDRGYRDSAVKATIESILDNQDEDVIYEDLVAEAVEAGISLGMDEMVRRQSASFPIFPPMAPPGPGVVPQMQPAPGGFQHPVQYPVAPAPMMQPNYSQAPVYQYSPPPPPPRPPVKAEPVPKKPILKAVTKPPKSKKEDQ